MSKKELSIGQSIAWNSLGNITYLGCSWLITILVVLLGADYSASGQLAVAMSVGNVFATVVLFRVRPVQVSGSYSQFDSSVFVGARWVTSIAAVIICCIYGFLTVSKSNYEIVALYCLFKFVESYIDVLHGIDQINNRLDYAAVSQILRGVLLVAGFIAGLQLFNSLPAAILLMSLSSLLVLVLYDNNRAKQFSSVTPSFALGPIASLLRICAPGFLASFCCTAVVSIVRQRYGLIYGDQLLGVYAAVAAPTVIVQALISYLYAPLLGPLASRWNKKDYAGVIHSIKRVALVGVAATLLLTIASLLFGEPVLRLLLGDGAANCSYYLPAMLFSTLAVGLNLFAIDLSIAFGRSAIATAASLVSFVMATVFSSCLYQATSFVDANSISLIVLFAQLIGFVIIIGYLFHIARNS